MNRRYLVSQQVWIEEIASPSVLHFLRYDLSQTHVARSNDLPFHGEWIQRLTTVVRSPDFLNLDPPCLYVNIHFRHISGERICRSQSGRSPLVHFPHGWGSVGPRGDQSAPVFLCLVERLEVRYADSRILLVVYPPVPQHQTRGINSHD